VVSSRGLPAKVFWLLSRSFIAIYSRLPILGALKGVVGIIRYKDSFLVIERNDGRGVSFPGGLQYPWESAEKALAREVHEETGLEVTSLKFKLSYFTSAEIPLTISVFDAEAAGQLRSSWEGIPSWLPLAELRQRLLPSQLQVLDHLPDH
jgi:8-oxo-dGTP pyrophosphatase MutT (NUDIX family)